MVIELEHNKKTNKQPKKTSSPWIIACIVICLLAIGGCIGLYFLGRTHGYDDGNLAGLNDGYDIGYGEGYNAGHSAGYSAGKSNGYNTGYNDGYKRAGCIIYGGSLCY